MRGRRILFVNPAYHYSFAMRDEFRRRGWKADILRSPLFPEKLLWSSDCLVAPPFAPSPSRAQKLGRILYLLMLAFSYDYFVVYGDAEVFVGARTSRVMQWLMRRFPSPELALLRLLGRKLIFFPNGCRQEALRADFSQHESGRVCANCALAEGACDDRVNQAIFDLVNRYHSLVIANTPIPSRQLPGKAQVRFLSLDLEVYRPHLPIPSDVPPLSAGRIRIMHSFFDAKGRHGSKNIKGSPFVATAVARLADEGYPVEYYYVDGVPLREMRYHQSSADVIVDQLIYGWWGSTAIESMTLGKPTVCYLTPGWKRLFLEAFPEYDDLPIIEATTDSIYGVLKRLLEDEPYRRRKGEEARRFAERHFDVRRNVPELEQRLQAL